MSKYLEILNNESFLMSEIKIIISNTIYYHSQNGYHTYLTSFNFIDIDNRIFSINVLFEHRSTNQIKELIIKKYNLTISDYIQNIEYENKAFNKKELFKIHSINIVDLL